MINSKRQTQISRSVQKKHKKFLLSFIIRICQRLILIPTHTLTLAQVPHPPPNLTQSLPLVIESISVLHQKQHLIRFYQREQPID